MRKRGFKENDKSRTTLSIALASLVLAVLWSSDARSHGEDHPDGRAFDDKAALSYSQSAIGRQIGNYTLRDRNGQTVELRDLGDRPLIVSMIYTGCIHTCPIITQTVARAVAIARDTLGSEAVRVATIGFDTPADTPERMGIFARQQGIDMADWMFLSADAKVIDDLAHDLGFLYFRSPKGFDHLSQTTLIDGEGRVVRQIYGEAFEPPMLVEPLKAMALSKPIETGGISGLIERVRLFCTVYDPAQDRYRFDYSIIMAFVTGIMCLAAVGIFLLRAWRQSHTQRDAIQRS